MERLLSLCKDLVIMTWAHHVKNEVNHVNHLSTDNCNISDAGLQNTPSLNSRQEMRLRS